MLYLSRLLLPGNQPQLSTMLEKNISWKTPNHVRHVGVLYGKMQTANDYLRSEMV